MKNYVVVYLLPRIEQASAVEERGLPGQYRHQVVMAAARESDIVSDLRQRGAVPLSVSPVKPRPLSMMVMLTGSRSSRERLLQAMVFSVQSGMSAAKALQRALEGDASNELGPRQDALNVLRAGGGFGDAIRALGLFEESTLAILESGERTGRMRESLEAALEHARKRAAGNKAMLGAVGWTFFDLFFAISTIVGLRYQLLPTISEQSQSQSGQGGDAAAQADFERWMSLAYWINDALIVGSLLLLAVATVCAVGHFSPNEPFRLKVDRFLRRIPALGKAIEHNAVSASFTVAAAMLKGGVAFLGAADVASRASRFEPVQQFWRTAHDGVVNGLSVVRALRSDVVHTSESLLIGAHNTQKQLAQVFSSIAEQRDVLALQASKQFAVVLFIASLLYSGVAVLFTLWVVFLQNSQMMSNLKTFG